MKALESQISVIVPVYNMAALLPRCLDSILNQTFKDIEIILVDDGSDDGSGAICTGYADKYENITAVRQANLGVSAARNAGINAARGRYLGFVDSDDWIEPEMFETLLGAIKRSGARISACGYRIHRYDGSVLRDPVDSATPTDLNIEQALESLIHPRGIQGFLCNKLFDRDLLFEAGGGCLLQLDERIHVCEDLLFVSRCIEIAGFVAYDRRPLYVYCVRDYGGAENYNRDRRSSELIALSRLVDSWTRVSPALGDYMKQKYTIAAYNILREAAGAGDRDFIPVLRKHLLLYLRCYICSGRVKLIRKARVLLTLVLPGFENRLKTVLRKK